ncbi:uncharacterized protein MELLADRAFT_124025 [Melampsora larici-populina 98AG31]|uniref:Barwin domain-containing protein n=1 Tax=Melampsora larici-populina (strain 98AG31 / pathotype 3-4-7) TaxID=747676 RepID=F4R7B7_MELLP|nr:uncharacterized protein MELLADRAFT_124025 [Melampsora larici-populina 98AG31]EGG11813.1 hypothetical protein MELLADRAFT_124025 [Melampsora larici-populina 98AG31]
MKSISTIILSFLIISRTHGLPIKSKSYTNGHDNHYHGKATWFHPDLGACGDYDTDDDAIIAINEIQYKDGESCQKSVKITNPRNGHSVKAKIKDLCKICPYGGLDLASSVFKKLEDLDRGVLSIDWKWDN